MIRKTGIKTILSSLMAAVMLAGCTAPALPSVPQSTAGAESTAVPAADIKKTSGSGIGKVRISEVMARNNATLRDSDGDFPDWIEIENYSSEDIDITGWTISDKESSPGWTIPAFTLYNNSRIIIFASKKDRADSSELHADFALSKGETIYLKNAEGELISSLAVDDDTADVSLAVQQDGSTKLSLYPTPGRENTGSAYDSLQENNTAAGPIAINEVSVYNDRYFESSTLGFCDWVELKNISSEPVDLSGYYISDDYKDLQKFNLPAISLEPGALIIILCSDSTKEYFGTYTLAPFSLSSDSESLYISSSTGALSDYAPLRNIPYGCTFGREDGKNGFFYFDEPTPETANGSGSRRVSEVPELLTADGVFASSEPVSVELAAQGTIYYTTDGTMPDKNSQKYSEPFTVSESCVVKAMAIESDELESQTVTFNYILGEESTLPVVCLNADNIDEFEEMYLNKNKELEVAGNVSYYGDDGSFSINCGIGMHGFSTLELPKKNLSLHFSGRYGESKLKFDLFDGGITEFKDLLLRGGGDQMDTIVRNEAAMNIAMEFSDAYIAQRNKYCILYLNGQYRGIYALMEKTGESLYAEIENVSEGSVIMNEATVEAYDEMYLDIIDFILMEDMSLPENYARVCDAIDIDSLIDWCIFEGWSGNNDLTSGNLRYVKSTENDGKWRLMLYDLDAAFYSADNCMVNVLDFWNQITMMNSSLMKNAEYRSRFLTRTAEALSTVLTEENIKAEYERLCNIIDPEVSRDCSITESSYNTWRSHIDEQMERFNGWNKECIANISYILRLTDEEEAEYFGQWQ